MKRIFALTAEIAARVPAAAWTVMRHVVGLGGTGEFSATDSAAWRT